MALSPLGGLALVHSPHIIKAVANGVYSSEPAYFFLKSFVIHVTFLQYLCCHIIERFEFLLFCFCVYQRSQIIVNTVIVNFSTFWNKKGIIHYKPFTHHNTQIFACII